MRDPISREESGAVQALAGWLLATVNVAAFSLMTIIITVDVVLRYVFNAPMRWTIEGTGALLLLLVFSSLPYVWERSAHIRMVILYDKFPPHAKSVADVITSISGMLFSALLTYQMARNVPHMVHINHRAEHLGFPYWPIAAFISIIGLIMFLQFLAHGWRALRGWEGR